MPPRRLPAVVVAGAVLALTGCGAGGLTSDAVDDVVEAWADAVCADDPSETDEAPRSDGAARSVECVSREAAADDSDATAILSVYDDPSDAEGAASAEENDCDVPYDVVAGPRWVSRLTDGWGTNDLLEVGGELVCEGN
ncbi:hypothetical protein [Aeromicrobium alkaliterrae]|uniref:Septum formation-related domain-containing protein n=1 Tax=Aeromicrobium alkaliterrae TaxID=302168 RepID=A0ABN2JM15_9ACTN